MRRMMYLLCAILPLLAAFGCSHSNNPVGPSQAPTIGQLLFALDAADNIASGTVTITKGHLTHVLPIAITSHAGSVTFTGIQVGHWHILVQLYDEDGAEIYTGEGDAVVAKNATTTVTIRVNHNTGNLEVIVLVPTPTPVPTYTISFADGEYNLYLIESDGTNLRQVISNYSTKDGANNYRGGDIFVSWTTSTNVWECNLDGSNSHYVQLMLNGHGLGAMYPKWSWDGDRIAGSTPDQGSDLKICTFDRDGNNVIVFPNAVSGDHERFTCWTPDDRLIFYNSSNFYIMNEDGTNRQVLSLPANSGVYDCSGDLTLLLGKDGGIAVMNISGTGLTQLTSDGGQAAFSADGQKITYTKDYQVYMMNRDGSGVVRVTDTPTNKFYPHFVF